MDYLLTGYRQTAGIRIYAFDRIGPERTRVPFTVSVDIALIRQYTISLQELPLLCRQFLEQHATAGGARILTFTEKDMDLLAIERVKTARAIHERKSKKPPPKRTSASAVSVAVPGVQRPDLRAVQRIQPART